MKAGMTIARLGAAAGVGVETVRYYQRLNRLIADPEVIAEYPQLVHRTRRLLNQRQRARRFAA